ncbi:EamA family transporter [Amycolatopsis palatopharyngis]|uniref:EamA family transporter n=1 Tax=Amycolatopsis palatopharyngis TaxID=187982 RepID=UPI000E280C0B|nr:EamA family transporter [Amycolatopsis palatopharyngis]
MGNRTWPVWAALGIVYVVWGSTYLAIRYLVGSLPPLLAAGLRFSIAGVILLVLVRVFAGRGALRMTRAQFGSAIVVGLLLAGGGQGLLTVAETQVASGVAALLAASIPLFVLSLRRLLGERPPAVTLFGVLLGLVGLAVLVLFGGPSEGAHGSAWWGPWIMLIAALSWSVGTVATTRLPMPANSFAATAVELCAGGFALSFVGLGAGQRVRFAEVTAESWIALVYLIVAGSLIAFTAYVYVLDRLPVSTVATYAYVNPVIAVLLGVWIAGEHIGPAQFAGGALVLAAVVVVVRSERRVRRAAAKVSVPAGTMAGSCEK